jgi:polyhydroxyalkanoate synthase
MKNLLREPGGIELAGVAIDLRQVRVPSYFVGAVEDHIAPWKSTYLGARLFGGPARFVLGGSGHIAGIVNPPSANKYGYWVNPSAKLADSADEWFAGAKHNSGSWWTDWQQWLKRRNGSERVAARDPNKGRLRPIEDAPGSYASVRLDMPKRP